MQERQGGKGGKGYCHKLGYYEGTSSKSSFKMVTDTQDTTTARQENLARATDTIHTAALMTVPCILSN